MSSQQNLPDLEDTRKWLLCCFNGPAIEWREKNPPPQVNVPIPPKLVPANFLTFKADTIPAMPGDFKIDTFNAMNPAGIDDGALWFYRPALQAAYEQRILFYARGGEEWKAAKVIHENYRRIIVPVHPNFTDLGEHNRIEFASSKYASNA